MEENKYSGSDIHYEGMYEKAIRISITPSKQGYRTCNFKRACEIVGMDIKEYKRSERRRQRGREKKENKHVKVQDKPWRCPNCRALIKTNTCIKCSQCSPI